MIIFCKESPDGKHCWHNKDNGDKENYAISIYEFYCCWCGEKKDETPKHGKYLK